MVGDGIRNYTKKVGGKLTLSLFIIFVCPPQPAGNLLLGSIRSKSSLDGIQIAFQEMLGIPAKQAVKSAVFFG